MIESSEEYLTKLWGDGSVRAFISHTHKRRAIASELKECLGKLGISSFVAHMDITPTKKWLREMQAALFSMDLLVAILSKGFKSSDWTDQEVGVAVGRQVPTISIKRKVDPYGFLSEDQAIPGSNSPREWAETIFEFAANDTRLREMTVDAFILATENALNFKTTDYLFEDLFPHIESLTDSQVVRLVDAFNENSQVHGAFLYNRRVDVPRLMKRLTGYDYRFDDMHRLRSPKHETHLKPLRKLLQIEREL